MKFLAIISILVLILNAVSVNCTCNDSSSKIHFLKEQYTTTVSSGQANSEIYGVLNGLINQAIYYLIQIPSDSSYVIRKVMSNGTASYSKKMTYKPEIINNAETAIYAFPTSGTFVIYIVDPSTGDISGSRTMSGLTVDTAGTFPSLSPSGNSLYFRAKNASDSTAYFCNLMLNDTSASAACYAHSVTSIKFTHALNDTIYFMTSEHVFNTADVLYVQTFSKDNSAFLNINVVNCSASCSTISSHGVAFSGLKAVFGVELDGVVLVYDYTVDLSTFLFSGTRYKVNGVSGTASIKAVYSRDNSTYIIVDGIESTRGSSVIKYDVGTNAHSMYSLESGYSITDCVVNLTSFNLVLGGSYSNNGIAISTATDRYTYHGQVYDIGSGVTMTAITNSDYEMTSLGQLPATELTTTVTVSSTSASQTDFSSNITMTSSNQHINEWTSATSYDVTYASSESSLSPTYTCVTGSPLTESVAIVQSGSNTLPSWVSWDSSSSSLRYTAACTTGTGDYIFDLQTTVNSDSTNLFTTTVTLSLNNSNL